MASPYFRPMVLAVEQAADKFRENLQSLNWPQVPLPWDTNQQQPLAMASSGLPLFHQEGSESPHPANTVIPSLNVNSPQGALNLGPFGTLQPAVLPTQPTQFVSPYAPPMYPIDRITPDWSPRAPKMAYSPPVAPALSRQPFATSY